MHGKKGTLFLYREHPIISPLSISPSYCDCSLVPKSYRVVLCGGIWERNKRCRPQIQSDNTIRYEFGTSRFVNLGNANSRYKPLYRPPSNVSPSLRKIHITVTQPKTFKRCVFKCYKVLH